MSFWETFQDNFDGFTEEVFRLASNNNQRRLRDYLRKFGVWIRRQQRYPIARSLHDALLEEEPTDWTEAEIMACHLKGEFASYYINRLIDSDFGRKPLKSRALTPTPAASAPAPFASPSPTPGPSAPAPANTPIFPTHTSGTEPPPAAYMQPSGAIPGAYMQPSGPTFAAYIQPPGTGLPPAAHTPPCIGPTFAADMQPSGIGSTTAAHTQPPGIGHTPAAYTQPPMRPTHAVYAHPSGTEPSPAVATTSTDHSTREVPDFAEIASTRQNIAVEMTASPSNE